MRTTRCLCRLAVLSGCLGWRRPAVGEVSAAPVASALVSKVSAPDPSSFAQLPPDLAKYWSGFGQWEQPHFPTVIGLQVEEIRRDYARMRVPWRSDLTQPAGVMHGGVIATLIDTVVVPAIGSGYDTMPQMLTLSINVAFLGAVRGEDAVGEGWITQRGNSVVFCDALVRTASGVAAAKGSLVYKVRPAPAG
jgi:uncharacterized protein (TIGR00369 family)